MQVVRFQFSEAERTKKRFNTRFKTLHNMTLAVKHFLAPIASSHLIRFPALDPRHFGLVQ